jgi:hypothetical protein
MYLVRCSLTFLTKLYLHFCTKSIPSLVRFEVFMAVFWPVKRWSLKKAWCFGGIYHLHLQGQTVTQGRNQYIAGGLIHACFLLGLHFDPEDVPLKCWASYELSAVQIRSHASQVTNVITSNPTMSYLFIQQPFFPQTCCWHLVEEAMFQELKETKKVKKVKLSPCWT